jgi:uncharacterized membrane protein YhaH (DUF805 family)
MKLEPTMYWSWLYLSLRGRLSPKSFAKGFGALFFVGLVVSQLTPTQRLVGYPLNHWAALAYALVAVWPWLAVTVKRLHDSGRSIALVIPAVVVLPAAEAAALASDYGALDELPTYIGGTVGVLIFCAWGLLMWCIYRFPSSPVANRFGPPPFDQSALETGQTTH